MWILGFILDRIEKLSNRLIKTYQLKKITHGINCHIEGGEFSYSNVILGNNVFIGGGC